MKPSDPQSDFIVAASAPRDAHSSGTLERAEEILAANPSVATGSIHTAAILGDGATVKRFLAAAPGAATAKGGPYGWDALTHLCFSRYLRLDRARTAGFVSAARALLDAGASANTGWFEPNHQPEPQWESVMYGAAGVAHHPELTRLLLARGANPNDGETPYHVPEGYDNAALEVLVESDELTQESISWMLLRKIDWHDRRGIKYLLDHGADPNYLSRFGLTALHQALQRDNDIATVELLLDRGADPTLLSRTDKKSAIALAARRGRGDVVALFERRGFPIQLTGVERLTAACARNDGATIRAIVAREPALVKDLVNDGAELLADFAGIGNTDGVRQLLDLGALIDAPGPADGYWNVPKNSTALHVAAWRAQHGTVKLLIERGAAVNALDGSGHTPLWHAVRACVDSYWKGRRSPESVSALLSAGASIAGITIPCGYSEVDTLLRAKASAPPEL